MRIRFSYRNLKDPPSHGTCPGCGRRVRLKKTGHVAAHARFKGNCQVTWKRPVELEGQPLVFESYREALPSSGRAAPTAPDLVDPLFFRMPLLDGVPAHWRRGP